MAVHHDAHIPVERSEIPWALREGAIGGIMAGIVFALFEMIVSAAMMGSSAFFMPLQMIGAILLGPAALEPGTSLWAAGLTGALVHMVLSVIYGMIFAVIVGELRSPSWDVGLGAVYGLALWLVNFYVIAPAAFPWFLQAPPVVQFFGHTVLFGVVLGWYVWQARERADIPAGVG